MKYDGSTVRKISRAVDSVKDPLKAIVRAASAACSKKNVEYAASLTKKAVKEINKRK